MVASIQPDSSASAAHSSPFSSVIGPGVTVYLERRQTGVWTDNGLAVKPSSDEDLARVHHLDAWRELLSAARETTMHRDDESLLLPDEGDASACWSVRLGVGRASGRYVILATSLHSYRGGRNNTHILPATVCIVDALAALGADVTDLARALERLREDALIDLEANVLDVAAERILAAIA